MESRVHIPLKSPLKDYVTSIWEVKGMRNCHETILPQGVVEVIFNFSDSITAILPHSNEILKAPRCFIQGINTHVVVARYSDQHHLFGVRLHPHMIKQMFGILPSELKNTTLDLSLIKPGFKELWNELFEAGTFNERVRLVENNFDIPLQAGCGRTEALSNLFISGGVDSFQSVDALAREVCYSTRQLNRVANTIFGVSAEELTVYKKFMQSVNHIHNNNHSLTSVAYQSGFYDQAHFCRVFKSYTGLTAKEYRNKKSETPFHIFS